VLVNTRDYFGRLIDVLEHAIAEHFMDERHRQMWQVVATPEEGPAALDSAPPWSAEAREFAAVR
jgi:predicted Rossmann-fold nucleotide-binding protein